MSTERQRAAYVTAAQHLAVVASIQHRIANDATYAADRNAYATDARATLLADAVGAFEAASLAYLGEVPGDALSH